MDFWGLIEAFFDLNFWQELTAVFIGAFIALWLNNWNERRKAKAKEKRILSTILRELFTNLSVLEHGEGLDHNDGYLLYAELKDESYRTYMEGGELKWIDDIGALSLISRAYYSIRKVQYYSEFYHHETALVKDKLDKEVEYAIEKIEDTTKSILFKHLMNVEGKNNIR